MKRGTKYDGLIESQSVDPIDITGLGLNPVLVSAEFFIDKLADSACAVRLFLIEDADLGGEKDLLKLKEYVCQSESAYFLSRSAVKPNLADLHG